MCAVKLLHRGGGSIVKVIFDNRPMFSIHEIVFNFKACPLVETELWVVVHIVSEKIAFS